MGNALQFSTLRIHSPIILASKSGWCKWCILRKKSGVYYERQAESNIEHGFQTNAYRVLKVFRYYLNSLNCLIAKAENAGWLAVILGAFEWETILLSAGSNATLGQPRTFMRLKAIAISLQSCSPEPNRPPGLVNLDALCNTRDSLTAFSPRFHPFLPVFGGGEERLPPCGGWSH